MECRKKDPCHFLRHTCSDSPERGNGKEQGERDVPSVQVYWLVVGVAELEANTMQRHAATRRAIRDVPECCWW